MMACINGMEDLHYSLCMLAELLALCYSEDVLISTDALLDATMEVIYDGLLRLEIELQQLRSYGADVSRVSGEHVASACDVYIWNEPLTNFLPMYHQ